MSINSGSISFLQGRAELSTPLELSVNQMVESQTRQIGIVTRFKSNPKKLYSEPYATDEKLCKETMKNRLSVDQDYKLWVLLHQTRDVMFKAREKEFRKYGITSIQAAVLSIVKTIEGKATPSEIARWLPSVIFTR